MPYDWIFNILDMAGLLKGSDPHKNFARIDGVNLFPGEYSEAIQFSKIKQLLQKQSKDIFVRLPFSNNTEASFRQSAIMLYESGINILAVIDQFHSNNSFQQRLNYIKSECSFIKHIELFNELPHMHYDGEQIASPQELVNKINQYTDWIHNNIGNSKVLSMATYNSLDIEDYNDWGISNENLLKKIIEETKTDITAIHCYWMDSVNKYRFNELKSKLNRWITTAQGKFGYRKSIWVTECGDRNWNKHIDYYEKWTSRFAEYWMADKILWYRHSVDKKGSIDSGYALEIRENNEKSPLYKKLES